VSEVATTLSPDGRSHPPHLRTWHDGWRHLRFLLMYSPRWLFLYPGVASILIGLAACFWLIPGPRRIGDVVFDVHTLAYAFGSMMVGFQLLAFAVFTKVFAITEGLLPEDPRLNRLFKYIKLETGLIVGALFVLLGISGSLFALSTWARSSFGPITSANILRVVLLSVFALVLGPQIIFSSFFLSILGLRRR
jgi:hypothetical protein